MGIPLRHHRLVHKYLPLNNISAFLVANSKSVLNSILDIPLKVFFLPKIFLTQLSMVSSKGKLVKSESISKEAIIRSAFCSLMFAANSKESFNTNLFLVRLDNMGTKNLAKR